MLEFEKLFKPNNGIKNIDIKIKIKKIIKIKKLKYLKIISPHKI